MAQTKTGAILARETMIAKFGPDYYKNLGKLGGKKGVGHKFAHGKVDPGVAGRIGGSRRKETND